MLRGGVVAGERNLDLPRYDMCKAVDRGMRITDVRVVEKHGGKSGSFVQS